MSNTHPPSDEDGATPYNLETAVQRSIYTIPTTCFVRPCLRIEPDTRAFESLPTIASRFCRLTEELPLAGADAMRSLADGTLTIIAALRLQMPWLTTAIDLLEEQLRLSLWAGRPWIAFRPMLLVGPPGSGKSHFARLFGDLCASGRLHFSMAGVADSTSIEGNPRGFNNTMPCLPALAMAQTGTANPILCVDEVDKAGHHNLHGDPVAAMLSLIEPGSAAAYWDRCLLAHVNVSHVNWLCTANELDPLPAPLRSRLDIIEVAGPSIEHFDPLVEQLQRGLARGWNMPVGMLPELADGARQLLHDRFARHRSVRRLRRELEAALGATIKLDHRQLN